MVLTACGTVIVIKFIKKVKCQIKKRKLNYKG